MPKDALEQTNFMTQKPFKTQEYVQTQITTIAKLVKDWGLRRQQLTNEIDVKCG
jgi:hypothetical protein